MISETTTTKNEQKVKIVFVIFKKSLAYITNQVMSSSELGRGQRQALRREKREIERKFDDLLTAVSKGDNALRVFLRSFYGKTDFKKKGKQR